MNLSEFLLARIAEDGAIALKGGWNPLTTSLGHFEIPEHLESAILISAERLLAECEAKRRIVELHFLKAEIEGCNVCHADLHVTPMYFPCETLVALALPYADHPDFDPDWNV